MYALKKQLLLYFLLGIDIHKIFNIECDACVPVIYSGDYKLATDDAM